MKLNLSTLLKLGVLSLMTAASAYAYTSCAEDEDGACTEATAGKTCDASGHVCVTKGGYSNTHCKCV